MPLFHVQTTSHFERDVRKLSRRNPQIVDLVDDLVYILKEDPANVSRRHKIRKLEGVKQGEGQWRIRQGDYRLRYDIIGIDVLLYSFRDRKDAYN